MKPIKFKDANIKFAEKQDEYNTLPALRLSGKEGYVVTCWGLNFWERVQVLFTGRVWLNLMTHNKPLTPVYMSAFRRGVFSKVGDSKLWGVVLHWLTKK